MRGNLAGDVTHASSMPIEGGMPQDPKEPGILHGAAGPAVGDNGGRRAPIPRASQRFLDGPTVAAEHRLAQLAHGHNLTVAFDRVHQQCRRPWIVIRTRAGASEFHADALEKASAWLTARAQGGKDAR